VQNLGFGKAKTWPCYGILFTILNSGNMVIKYFLWLETKVALRATCHQLVQKEISGQF